MTYLYRDTCTVVSCTGQHHIGEVVHVVCTSATVCLCVKTTVESVRVVLIQSPVQLIQETKCPPPSLKYL